MKQSPALVSLFACRGFEVHRHAQPGTATPTSPERVTLRNKDEGQDRQLEGQDATDLLDQLTHARDSRHMADICRDAWGARSGPSSHFRDTIAANRKRAGLAAFVAQPASPGGLISPTVRMSKPAAILLSAALGRARQRLVAEIARVDRSRIPEVDKVAAVTLLRSDLATLQEFQAAHEEAHGLGGY
jgi:hypothetical protein